MAKRTVDEVVKAVHARIGAGDYAGAAAEFKGLKGVKAGLAALSVVYGLDDPDQMDPLHEALKAEHEKPKPPFTKQYFLTYTSVDTGQRPSRRSFKDPAKLVEEARYLMKDVMAYDTEAEVEGDQDYPSYPVFDMLFEQAPHLLGGQPAEDPVEIVRRLGYGDVLKIEDEGSNTWEVEAITIRR